MVKIAQLSEKALTGQELIPAVRERLKQHLRGKEDIIDFSLAAFLAGGHLLLEGPPGTGKTSLAKGLAGVFGGSFRRVQMTSDLLPSDVVGMLRLKPQENDFEFRPGPIFANFLMADELNRTSAKTQSALLEAMAEHTVTVDGKTYPLPDPFFVVATQNPLEFQGVYPLAESQLDRFMLQLHLTSPEKKDELEIYQRSIDFRGDAHGNAAPAEAEMGPLVPLDQARRLRAEVARVFVEESILEYATDLIRSTRFRPEVLHGVSIRGGLQLMSAARALAFIRGRDFVGPGEIADLAVPVLAHRLCFQGGEPDPTQRRELIQQILERVRPPK